MTNPDRSRRKTPNLHLVERTGNAGSQMDEEMARLRRLGARLFGVADCVVTLERAADAVQDELFEEEAETFCRGMATPAEPVVIGDLRNDRSLAQHPQVSGAPGLRFYAAHPVRAADGAAIGSVSLLDSAPRSFGEEDRLLLADLAALVERELELRSMSASHFDLKIKNKNLTRKSLIDPLLGTWNRGAIMRLLTIEAARCDKAGLPLSLIVLDVDHFKKINDTCGHPAGDTVLVKVASRLRSCIRAQEALGRYGGEEFLVVLPGTPLVAAMAVAERMRAAIAQQPEIVGETTLNLTISAGVASTDLFPAATTEELISRADVALYAAKDAGRNRVAQAQVELP
jgi:diguanylate cyclase (GGDEF)-like protein